MAARKIDSTEALDKIRALRKEYVRATIASEDMFWSPQEKEKYLKEIDKEISTLEKKL